MELCSDCVQPESIKQLAPCLALQRGLTRLLLGLGRVGAAGAQALEQHMHAHPSLASQTLMLQCVDFATMSSLARWYKTLPELHDVLFDHIIFDAPDAEREFARMKNELHPGCRVERIGA